jgi:hypothetical protein
MIPQFEAARPHFLSQLVIAVLVAIGGAGAAQAQGPGGGGPFGGRIPSPEESFRSMDRNDNDQIDPEEWDALPPFVRGIWEREGVDLNSPLSYDDFIDRSRAMLERMQSGGGFRGGPPGMGGGPGGGRGDGDRGRGGPRGGFGGGPGSNGDDDPPGSAPAGDSKGTKSQSKPKVRLTLKLPDSYRSKDKDSDGQIGLYEWPKNDYAGFKRLDHNGDGFLTPQELARGPRSVAVASSGPSSRGGGKSDSGGSSAAPAADSTPAASSSAPKSPGEKAFDLLDKDKNTTISEEEWKKSLLVGPAFKKAGIGVSFPLPRGEFLRLYPQAFPPK